MDVADDGDGSGGLQRNNAERAGADQNRNDRGVRIGAGGSDGGDAEDGGG